MNDLLNLLSRRTEERDMFLHKKAARHPEGLNPDNWAIDAYAFSIPANRAFMSRLFYEPHDEHSTLPEMELISEGPAAEDTHRLGPK